MWNKIVCKLLLVIFLCPAWARATEETTPAANLPNISTEVRVYNIMQKEERSSEVLVWADGNIGGPFGYFIFVNATSDGYHQVGAGPTLQPFSWLELGVGIRKENVENSNLWAAYFSADGEKLVLSGYFESGAAEPYQQINLNYHFSDYLDLGIMDQTGKGFGPRVAYKITENSEVWGAVLRDSATDTTNTIFSANFLF